MDHIVLVGLMGSGKTTVGARLAAALGVPHRDSDTDIERETGMTGRQHAGRDGIDAIHALESRHLLEALAQPGATVISAAASILDDPACRSALRDARHLVVWLDASPAALAARLRPDDHRPASGRTWPTSWSARPPSEARHCGRSPTSRWTPPGLRRSSSTPSERTPTPSASIAACPPPSP